MKIGLNEYPLESMRSPEEIRQDEDRERHLDGYCEGAPWCWVCQEEKEQAAELLKKTPADLDRMLLKGMKAMFDLTFGDRRRP